ncbi:MAG: hypothetical protein OEU26_08200 [Candidatus Tectomicrobia bacterium]|nr:hypothetical protein [Candidatus Tectomicrobia bacterium]
MRRIQRVLGIVSIFALLSGCAYQAAVNRLSPDEQAEFRAHSKVMNDRQARTYLSKATPAERSTYLQEIGTAQRFASLNEEDQASVLSGYIRKGMSAEAVRFLWGEPGYTAGYTGHYERWVYAGSAYALTESGHQHSDAGTSVEVHLTDGLVDWWFESVTESDDDLGEDADRQRF